MYHICIKIKATHERLQTFSKNRVKRELSVLLLLLFAYALYF